LYQVSIPNPTFRIDSTGNIEIPEYRQ